MTQWNGDDQMPTRTLELKDDFAETQRLLTALGNLVDPDTIPVWLQTPNDAFGGLKPLEVVERGETDRLWRMVFFLESGVPT